VQRAYLQAELPASVGEWRVGLEKWVI